MGAKTLAYHVSQFIKKLYDTTFQSPAVFYCYKHDGGEGLCAEM